MQKPLFVVVVSDGMISSVQMLNGDPDAVYLLIDEDSIEMTQEEDEQDLDTDALIRQRLTTDPDQFRQAVDGAVTSPLDLYPENSRVIFR